MSLENRLKRNFTFNSAEKHEFIFSTIVVTIILFMFMWRTTDYTILTGIKDLILAGTITLISLFIFVGGIKFFAIEKGYVATYNYWIGGLMGGFLVSFIAYGYLPIVFPGILTLKSNDRLKHGRVFIGENKVDVFWILASGLVTTILFSFTLLLIYSITQIEMFYYAALLNAFIAFFATLPFPNNIGLHMFYMKRQTYYLFLGLVAFMLVIIQAKTILSLIIGLCVFATTLFVINKFVLKKYDI